MMFVKVCYDSCSGVFVYCMGGFGCINLFG